MKKNRGRPRVYDPAGYTALHIRHFPKELQGAVLSVAGSQRWTFVKALAEVVRVGLRYTPLADTVLPPPEGVTHGSH